ncbi:ABC transporter permease [Tautonia rosea]|uniref:ABC transporter permease n=1 Tax=Tautonia rosea TaxID=2728037 RepID=UPI00147470C5|nr:DUF3526 domain-containing protein [Tautonia rosea]
MVLRIAQHEARLLIADRTLIAVSLVLVAIVAYGVANGASWVAFQQSTRDGIAAEEQERYRQLRERLGSPGSGTGVPADQVGTSLGARYAALPSGPLAAFVIGQSDLYPSYVKVSTEGRQSFAAADEIENPVHLLTGRFDLGFVIITLYPLIILALSYNLLSNEKEQGTLVLLLSQPLRLRTLVAGKVLTRAIAVVGLAIVVSIGSIALSGQDAAEGDFTSRLALWLAIVVSYGAFWFALAVAINALGRSSATNAVALAGTWLLLVAVVPALVNVLVRATYPVPSRVELVQAIRNASNEAQTEGTRLKARYFEDHPELVGAEADYSEFAIQSLATQNAIERSIAETLDHFENQLRRQQTLVDRLRFLSPAIAAFEALQDAAGTGSARYRHFMSQVESFHAQWRAYFHPLILRAQPIQADELERIPTFTYEEEPISQVTERVTIGLIGLVIPAAALAAISVPLLRRFTVVS